MNPLRRLFRKTPADAIALPPDIPAADAAIIRQVLPFTMTSVERLAALLHATRYLARHNIAGAIVECGVWRGGSMMAAALALLQENDNGRDLWLFDTFTGMTPPADVDRSFDGTPAAEQMRHTPKGEGVWCACDLADVQKNLASTGYPLERIRYVEGPVEKTIPEKAPAQIALLRLDTDWYASTRHELEHLFPRLAPRGILIIDDYGHWQGARQATDEYFAQYPGAIYLHRIDYTGRIGVKFE